MRNDTRNRIHIGITAVPVRIAVLAGFSLNAAVTPILAWADVPTPPPAYHKQIDTSFPSGKALLNQGYNPNTGVLKVEGQKTGKPTVTSNGQTVTGTQNARVVVTDQYGNKGAMSTKITQTANAVVIANVVGNAVGNGVDAYERYISDQIKDGNYSGAAETVFAAFARSLDELSGGNLSRLKRWSGGDGLGLIDQHDRRMNDYYGGNPTTGNPSSPSTSNPSSPTTGTPTSPGNPSNPSVGGGGSSSGLGAAANAAGSAQRTAERNGDVSGATGNAAFKKAADAAANAETAKDRHQQAKDAAKRGDKVYQVVLSYTDYGAVIKSRTERKSAYTDKGPDYGSSYAEYDSKGVRKIVRSSHLDGYLPGSLMGAGNALVTVDLVTVNTADPSRPTVRDMTLSADEITDILKRMFASQQTNHREMMNQLSQIAANTASNTSTTTNSTSPSTTGSQVIRGGDSVVDQATTSRTVSMAEAISSPFTPANSNVAGRTKFTLNSDGSVTTTFVPDTSLKPHSSQAPTRTSAAPSAPQTADATTPNIPGQTTPTTPSPTAPDTSNGQQNQEQRDFCQYNPTAAQCADLGNSDYEDLDVPESEIDLELEPLDVFSTDGTCPENVSFEFGALGSFEFDYGYICGVLRLIRPILIIGTIITCSFVAYGAIKEL